MTEELELVIEWSILMWWSAEGEDEEIYEELYRDV